MLKLIDDLRADFAWPQLPFIACTIGAMRPDERGRRNADMNRVLFSLNRFGVDGYRRFQSYARCRIVMGDFVPV